MTTSASYPLRAFPRRLVRSLLGFAAAGTFMAFAVWSEGTGGPWLGPGMALACWGIPAAFAWRIRRQGFDPLARIELTDDGVLAVARDGSRRLLTWAGIDRLVQVDGFRNRSWMIGHAHVPALRWYGEVEDEAGLEAALAARTGLEWEFRASAPD